MEHDTGWVNVWESETTHCQARRIGRTVFVRCEVANGMSTGGDWNAFTTLPKGMRPDGTCYVAGSSLSGKEVVNVRIEPSGIISIISDTGTTKYWNFSASFPAA